jgi:hypothetical protein
MSRIARRSFLKAASTAITSAAVAVRATRAGAAQRRTAPKLDPRISDTAYTPVPDYPIQPKRHAEVTVADSFWKPKITTNADVTIPFEVQKVSEMPGGFGGNVLEAAILSLQTHPNARLQAQVDARIQDMKASPGRGTTDSRSRQPTTTRPETGICSRAPSGPPTRSTPTSSPTVHRFPAANATQSTACSCIGRRTTRSISIWRSTISTSEGWRTR